MTNVAAKFDHRSPRYELREKQIMKLLRYRPLLSQYLPYLELKFITFLTNLNSLQRELKCSLKIRPNKEER